jgi:predicted nucleotidyltransferase
VEGCQHHGMRRERAVELAELLLTRLDAAQHEWPTSLITEVSVFGSFARGALQPTDLDIAVVLQPDTRWVVEMSHGLGYGLDPHVGLRRALVGSLRSYHLVFNTKTRSDLSLTLLWRRGDTLAAALARLYAIPADPAAGQAPRDAMLQQFEGLDRWIHLAVREQLVEAVGEGAITLERLTLLDGTPADRIGRTHLRRRWKETSPLCRAGCAVLAYFENRGISPAQVHLHGKDVRDEATPYFAGFNLKYLRFLPVCLTVHGGREWIEVVHPAVKDELQALRIVPLDRAWLEQARW